jgi:hypothetical protein
MGKWYNKYKIEESIYHSNVHRDYLIISMYEILGNSTTITQFCNQYYSVFCFMINRYVKQFLLEDEQNGLRKIVLTLRKRKNCYVAIDFGEEEREKETGLESAESKKVFPEYVNILMSSKFNQHNLYRYFFTY